MPNYHGKNVRLSAETLKVHEPWALSRPGKGWKPVCLRIWQLTGHISWIYLCQGLPKASASWEQVEGAVNAKLLLKSASFVGSFLSKSRLVKEDLPCLWGPIFQKLFRVIFTSCGDKHWFTQLQFYTKGYRIWCAPSTGGSKLSKVRVWMQRYKQYGCWSIFHSADMEPQKEIYSVSPKTHSLVWCNCCIRPSEDFSRKTCKGEKIWLLIISEFACSLLLPCLTVSCLCFTGRIHVS